jgi:hypothetical protein
MPFAEYCLIGISVDFGVFEEWISWSGVDGGGAKKQRRNNGLFMSPFPLSNLTHRR